MRISYVNILYKFGRGLAVQYIARPLVAVHNIMITKAALKKGSPRKMTRYQRL